MPPLPPRSCALLRPYEEVSKTIMVDFCAQSKQMYLTEPPYWAKALAVLHEGVGFFWKTLVLLNYVCVGLLQGPHVDSLNDTESLQIIAV